MWGTNKYIMNYCGYLLIEKYFYDDGAMTAAINEQINIALSYGQQLVLFFGYAWEKLYHEDLDRKVIPKLRRYAAEAGYTDKFYVIVDKASKDYLYTDWIHGDIILYVDYFLLRTYQKIVRENHPTSTVWHPQANKALFLTGKAHKAHRIGLLSKLYDKQMLDQVEWSLFVNEQIAEDSRQFVPQMSDAEYQVFLSKCIRNPDGIAVCMQENSSHYGGFPYSVELYSTTSLSIISETFMTPFMPRPHWKVHDGFTTWITEKTWKTIANKHPFLMANHVGTLVLMREMGFKTFDEYMLIKDYDLIFDGNERLDAIVTNAQYFLNTCHKYIDQINHDIEHNYARFIELTKINEDRLYNDIFTISGVRNDRPIGEFLDQFKHMDE